MKSCIWLAFIALVGVGSIGTDLLPTRLSAPDGVAPPPPTEPVVRTEVFAAGIVEGAQRSVELQFELSGRIVEIPVVEGQTVRQGDVCARLDDAMWQHRLHEAEAALDVERAELERLINGATAEARSVVRADARLAEVQVQQAKANWDRAARLYEQKAISAQDYDHYRFVHEAALARLEQARARVAEIEAPARPDEVRRAQAKVEMAATAVIQGQTQLDRTVLRAPIDGVVLRIDMEPGELVAAEQPRPVLTMTSLREVRVRAYVEELDALALQPGAPAYVTVDGKPDVRYSGRVVWAAPVMGPKSQRHHQPGEKYDVEVREVLIVLDEAQDLVVGLPVDVFISTGDATPPASTRPTDELPADVQAMAPRSTETHAIDTNPVATQPSESQAGDTSPFAAQPEEQPTGDMNPFATQPLDSPPSDPDA